MSNFLSNIGSASHSPTYFELVMVDQGGTSLWPAFEHVVRTLFNQFPTSTALSYSYFYGRELYAILRGIVETYFLIHKNCTAFELLYALRRAAVADEKNTKNHNQHVFQQSKPPPNLKRGVIIMSIVEIVLLPYVGAKLDQFHERVVAFTKRIDQQNKQQRQQQLVRSKGKILADGLGWVFINSYPYIRKCIGIVLALYQLVFCLGRTQYFSLLQHICKYRVVRHVPLPDTPFNAGSKLATEMLNLPKTFKEKCMAWGATTVQYSVIAGVLGFKFFEWWYTAEVQELAQKSSGQPVPPPPPPSVLLPSTMSSAPRSSSSVVCPLCNEQCTNMSASPSGFIYCYPCLYKYIKEHGKTPKGGLPCSVLNIRKCWVN
jgi:peroxin-12